MSALAIVLSVTAIYLAITRLIWAVKDQTREMRAIAEEQADERRKAGIAAGFARGYHGGSRVR